MNCAVCGKTATKLNSKGVPLCPIHSTKKVSAPNCPNCGIEMVLRESKFGKFWDCKAFPMCNGIKKI